MRELKFRVWNGLEMISLNNAIDRWLVWIQRSSSSNNWILEPFFYEVMIMQYTWLKDKNGKDIFEGDIMKRFDDMFNPSFNIFLVKFDNHFLQYQLFKYDKNVNGKIKIQTIWEEFYWIDLLNDPKNFEIIGNIHENPELLTITH